MIHSLSYWKSIVNLQIKLFLMCLASPSTNLEDCRHWKHQFHSPSLTSIYLAGSCHQGFHHQTFLIELQLALGAATGIRIFTNSMWQNPSWEANTQFLSQNFMHFVEPSCSLPCAWQLATRPSGQTFLITTITTNQPKKLTKGGVLHRRTTSSLARLNHSYIRNA
jgi:hypothetical protein